MKNITKLTFKRFIMTIGNLPSSYVESLSYYECLVWLCNYLEKTVISTVNNNGEAVEELQEKYVELKNYVDTYFENLDVQEEIDNKLDEMADSGQLADIIAQYIELAGVLAYNTKADLKSATNIVDGSICRTLGTTTYNDGYGAYYKIRTITSGDVVDDNNILALTISDTLIAEKMPDYYINNLQNQINEINENLTDEKIIFIGDSYGDNLNSTTDEFTIRLRDLMKKDNLNLTNSDFYIWNVSGARVIQDTPSTSTYLSQLENHNNVISATDKLKVKKIFLLAGHNDTIFTKTNIVSALGDLYTYAKTQYPNANIYIGCIGYDKRSSEFDLRLGINNIVIPAYKESVKFGFKYLNNVEYVMRDYSLYDSTEFHPNEEGHKLLAQCIYNSLYTGNINDYSYETEEIDLLTNIKFNTTTKFKINYIKNNDKLNINIYGNLTFDTPISNVDTSDLNVNLCSMSDEKYFRYYSLNNNIPVICDVVYSDYSFTSLSGYLQFGVNNIRLYLLNSNKNTSLTITGLKIYTNVTIDRIIC